jgi:hypothetical protein
MKKLLLERKPTTPTHTEGFLSWPGGVVCTIERPWIEDGNPGGKANESCVPAGVYSLRPHTRGDGKKVVALVNSDLGVYYLEDDMLMEGKGGRFLILIHIANWVKDIIGCVGPGLWKTDSTQGRMVKSSAKAMKKIMDYISGDEAEIEIRWIT